MPSNLELKVRCSVGEMRLVREAATAAGLGPFAPVSHRDTYFHAPQGRLKLREIRHEDGTELAELIGYGREDIAGARWSRYTRVEIPVSSAEELRQALGSTLGVMRVVDKVREVGVWRRTRIHLDQVKALGLFVELETVTGSATDPTARQELDEVVRMLGLDQLETIPGSYADL